MDALRLARRIVKSVSLWNVRRIWHLYRTQGMERLLDRASYAFSATGASRFQELEPTPRELNRQRKITLPFRPRISLAMAAYNTPAPFLKEMVDSIFAQTYTNWELCIADGGSTEHGVVPYLQSLVQTHPGRVKVVFLTENKGIAGNQNEAIRLCSGDFIGLVDHDDLLTGNALFAMVERLNQDRSIDLLYSDESIMDATGTLRLTAHLKPDYAPDTLRGCNYFCHLTLLRKDLMDRIGGVRLGFDGAQDYDLVLRATEQAKNIAHVAKVLYLWRMHPGSTAQDISAKPYAIEAGRRAIQDHLDRLGLKGTVEVGPGCTYKPVYELRSEPRVTIVIPNKDNAHYLKTCVASIVELSSYKNLDIVIVENNSHYASTFHAYTVLQRDPRVRVISFHGAFNFSELVNFGVQHAAGEYVLLLNNDTEVIAPNWIEKMLEYGQRDDVGVVGAKLLYPDNHVQHAGIVVGIFGVAGHVHRGWWAHAPGYIGRLCMAQNMSAVTAACMLVRKTTYERLGGFDPKLAVAFNDVDFCLRVLKAGQRVVFTPEAVLYHFESRTRGYEDTPEKLTRFKREIAFFHERWRDFLLKGDPFYNPNLTLLAEDFRIGTPFDGMTMPFPVGEKPRV